MVDTYQSCMERANAAADAAAKATLDNVRERELRAEKTWRGLAEKARAVARQRVQVEQEKAQQRAAEAELQAEAATAGPASS